MRLKKSFYERDAVTLAPLLLGKILCRRLDDNSIIRRRICETEAYLGESDTACHASRGKTKRTAVMYESGGVAYVYLCYGIHEMLNIVSGKAGSAEAVLIRGVEGFSGPGRTTRALEITRALNAEDLSVSQRLWLEDDGLRPEYETSKRVGIGYASEEDINRLWRFRVKKPK